MPRAGGCGRRTAPICRAFVTGWGGATIGGALRAAVQNGDPVLSGLAA